jgi:hypothetical protein
MRRPRVRFTVRRMMAVVVAVGVGLAMAIPIGSHSPRHTRVALVGTTSVGASASVPGQRGASPLQVDVLRPVTEGNCVAARRGGEQPEVNDQSATRVNSIRPSRAASLPTNGEAQTGASRVPPALRGSVLKRWGGRGGGWRRNGPKARYMKQRDPRGPEGCS